MNVIEIVIKDPVRSTKNQVSTKFILWKKYVFSKVSIHRPFKYWNDFILSYKNYLAPFVLEI